MTRGKYLTCLMCGREWSPPRTVSEPRITHTREPSIILPQIAPDIDHQGKTPAQLLHLIPNDASITNQVLAVLRWPQQITCPKCQETTTPRYHANSQQQYSCLKCRRFFTPRTNSFIDIKGIRTEPCMIVLKAIITTPEPVTVDYIRTLVKGSDTSVNRVKNTITNAMAKIGLTTSPPATRDQLAALLNLPPSAR